MQISTGAFAVWCLSIGGAAAFTKSAPSRAFVARANTASTPASSGRAHSAACACPSCAGLRHSAACACAACISRSHSAGCACLGCAGFSRTALFADTASTDEGAAPEAAVPATDDVPEEVVAMDGVDSEDEAHNIDRPARKELKKKSVRSGKELSELEVGTMVTGTIKSLTSYGAFVDIGAQADGLIHISQLASGFVSEVTEVVKEGQEVEVRIIKVDEGKNQIGLSMMSEKEAAADEAGARGRGGGGGRRDDSGVLKSLNEKGFDSSVFVEATVVNTVDFGCFVRVDTSLLNSEVEGQVEGLVHISALGNQRVNQVTDVVNVDDKVQVRLKEIQGNKVGFTMLSVEDEATKAESRGGGGPPVQEGAKDWKESLEKLKSKMPEFTNGPMIMDRR